MNNQNSTVVRSTREESANFVNTSERKIANADFSLPATVSSVQKYQPDAAMKEIADITMTLIEDRFFNEISASDILKISKRDVQSRDTVKAIIAASQIPMAVGIAQLITREVIKILCSPHEWSQTTAAKYLSEKSEEMWFNTLISALKTAKDIPQISKSTSRAKSFRNMINRAISANPKSSPNAILMV
jgi:hypothetical protein